MAHLEVTNLSVEYMRTDGTVLAAVKAVSLEVQEGEFLCIVGPSGCGKTTFLKTLDGLIEPVSGKVLIDGHPIGEGTGDRAMVFQEASLFPWFNIRRNISYGLECRGIPRRVAGERVAPFIELVGLSGFESQYPHEISGGMQQRANLARALAVDPEILLMDEPFAALDAQTRELMQAELLDIWSRSRKTVIFITHQINEAIYLADRVVVFSKRPGTIIRDMPIEIERPRQLDVKRSSRFLEYEDELWSLIEPQMRASSRRAVASAGEED